MTQKVPATVVARNSTLDLALLMVSSDNIPQQQAKAMTRNTAGLRLASGTAPPPVGALVFAHGYPASRLRGPAMTSGIVCGIADGLGAPDNDDDDDDGDTRSKLSQQQQLDTTIFVVTNAAMSGGMSGGPLVDASGSVVGVNALIRPDLRALGNFAVSSLELVDFLQSAKSKLRDLTEGKDSSRTSNGSTSTSTTTSSTTIWLYNDRMNKKERVASILQTVVGLNTTSAEEVMMQAHTMGRGMVGNYSSAESAVSMGQALRDQDLLVEWETAY
jgi:ATP-dependent Clp protease adapter protein ClpS